MDFVNAMNKYGYTENGALTNNNFSNKERDNVFMTLFFHTIRKMEIETYKKTLSVCFCKDKVKTMILLFNIRDVRGGKGERDLFREGFRHLMPFLDSHIVIDLLKLVPDYGRYDDMIVLNNSDMFEYIFELIKKDKKDMKDGKGISLLAKWMPSEKSKLDKELNFVTKFCKVNKLSMKEYRVMLSELRSYLNIVEKLISTRRWSDIDYDKVPSCAMNNLKKAFEKHDKIGFMDYIEKLKNNEVKINVKQLFPHTLSKQAMKNNSTDILNEQWRALVTETKKQTKTWMRDFVCVADVSGSMECGESNSVTPIQVSIGLSLLISEVSKPPFDNKLITFSERPTWHTVNEKKTFYQKVNALKSADWGMSTDLYSVFKLILDVAVKSKLKSKDIPGLIIISDMQFNQADKNNKTNLEKSKELFNQHELSLPTIIFWNVSQKCLDFPATDKDQNVGLVSGFSPSIMKCFMEYGEINPNKLIDSVVKDKRYDPIKEVMLK
jgi:hypothetical protein